MLFAFPALILIGVGLAQRSATGVSLGLLALLPVSWYLLTAPYGVGPSASSSSRRPGSWRHSAGGTRPSPGGCTSSWSGSYWRGSTGRCYNPSRRCRSGRGVHRYLIEMGSLGIIRIMTTRRTVSGGRCRAQGTQGREPHTPFL